MTDPEGNRSTTEYNLVGWPLRIVTPRGNEPGAVPEDFDTTYDAHNPWGDWTSITDPAGATTTRTFNPNRLVESLTDAASNTTVNVYDDADQLVEVQRPDTTTVGSRFRADGLLEAQIDSAGAETVYAYDALDRTISVTDPLGRTTSHRYDAAGNLVATEQPGGDCNATPAVGCIVRIYDAGERLTSIDYSDPGTPDVTGMTYDPVGRRTALSNGLGELHLDLGLTRTADLDLSPGNRNHRLRLRPRRQRHRHRLPPRRRHRQPNLRRRRPPHCGHRLARQHLNLRARRELEPDRRPPRQRHQHRPHLRQPRLGHRDRTRPRSDAVRDVRLPTRRTRTR